MDRITILADINYSQVCCYQYARKYEARILELLNSKYLVVENSLFSIPEQQYLNYVLNKAKFGNGLDLRNKYVHGTYSLDIKKQETDYLELLKIMVLIIIKINEEFCLRFPNPEEI